MTRYRYTNAKVLPFLTIKVFKMSLGSGFLENLPHFTFTPAEHQVECVRVAAGRNLTFVLTQPQEKSFLVLMLIKEVGSMVRGGFGKAALLVYDADQVALWTSFLTRYW